MPPILILAGPTASGKSHLASVIAKKHGGVIINADAMQLYREIPVITAQPSQEEQREIPHRLYGAIPASEACSAGKWLEMAVAAIDETHAAGKLPIVVGGTGLYIRTLMEGISPIPAILSDTSEAVRQQYNALGNAAFYALLQARDPVMAGRLRPSDSQRLIRAMEVLEQTGISLAKWQETRPQRIYPPERFTTLFLNPERNTLYAQCDQRFDAMLHAGALEEVRDTLALDAALPAMKALGIQELRAYLRDEVTLEAAVEKAKQSTRNYAKRQVTWFRHQLKGARECADVGEASTALSAFCLTSSTPRA